MKKFVRLLTYILCSDLKVVKLHEEQLVYFAAKFWHQNGGAGGQSNSLSDVGVLRAGTERRICCVHRASGEDHGAAPEILFPRW